MNYKKITLIFFTLIIFISLISFSLAWYATGCAGSGGCRNVCNTGGNGNRNCCSGRNWVYCEDHDDGCGRNDNKWMYNILQTNSPLCGGGGTPDTGPVCPGTGGCVNLGIVNVDPVRVTTEQCLISENMTLNGTTYSLFGTPGFSLTLTGFDYFKWDPSGNTKTFYMLNITSTTDSTKKVWKTNVANNGPSVNSTKRACTTDGAGCTVAGHSLGQGTFPRITYVFTDNNIGGFNYNLSRIANSIPETFNSWVGPAGIVSEKESNVYIGLPSLVIMGPTDVNTGFFEKSGQYEKKLFFNLINTSPLDLNLENYRLICNGVGVSCSMDPNYAGFQIPKLNGDLILTGTLRVDKNKLPTTVGFVLDVNYTVPALKDKDCGDYYTGKISTSLKPTLLKLGLMDKQKFQVGLISESDSTNCVGENGMIGQTGEDFVPRVNVGFGGTIDSNKKLISINECDTYDINGSPNPNWVYCSRKEFLVELARKIDIAWTIQKTINDYKQSPSTSDDLLIEDLELEKQKYLSFETNIRKQSLSKENVLASITNLNSILNSLTVQTGLENFGTQDKIKQATRLTNLFSNVNFTSLGGEYFGEMPTGTYKVNIKLRDMNINTPDLFETDDKLNPKISISVDFSTLPVAPELNWFFYDYADEDFSTLTSKPQLNNFNSVNIMNRGKLFSINHDPNNTSPRFDYNFYPNYAVPLFVRLKTDTNGDMNNTFSTNITEPIYNFSYWTGFASSSEDGCENIASEELTTNSALMPYRESDSVKTFGSNDFYFPQFENNKPNSTIYLETILFWPSTTNDTKTINSPFEIYTNNNLNNSKNNVIVNNIVETGENSFYINNIERMFDAIKDEKVCVYQGVSAVTTNWTLFWNTKKIYDSISDLKINVIEENDDATICESREALGG